MCADASNRSVDAGYRAWDRLQKPGIAAASYVVAFGLLAAPLLPAIAAALPQGPNREDEELIVWILCWVAHALATNPLGVFEANINYPAPAQLTGSEHFFSAQILFGPIYALARNPLLAANLAALATYPLAAWSMQRLLLQVGCRAPLAWVAGFVFALGPRRVPFNLHILQYANFFLPLVALCLVRLRARPDVRRTLGLLLAFGLGIFSSFYMAVLVGIVALVWGLFEWASPAAQRNRFVGLALTVAFVTGALALGALEPYFGRLDTAAEPPTVDVTEASAFAKAVWGTLPGASPYPLAPLVFLSIPVVLAGAVRGVTVARHCLGPALVLATFGILFMPGVPAWLADVIEWTPIGFFTYTVRFQLLFSFAGVLLITAALESVTRFTGARWPSTALAISLLAFVTYDQGFALAAKPLRPVPALGDEAFAYRALHDLAREHGTGPLLQLPTRGHRVGDDRIAALETDAMLGSTVHWLPLVTGYTGHQPAHRPLLQSTLAMLHLREVLRDVVDMTGVRWILIRPEHAWEDRKRYRQITSRLSSSPEVAQMWELDGWIFLSLKQPDLQPRWLAALRTGTPEDATLLGTPWRRLEEEEAIGRLQWIRASPGPLEAGQGYPIILSVHNAGPATWPVSVRPDRVLRLHGFASIDVLPPLAVALAARWIPRDATDDEASIVAQRAALRRDLAADETLLQRILLVAPERPGRYRLEIGLEQMGGASFTQAPNQPIAIELEVVEPGRLPTPQTEAGAQTNSQNIARAHRKAER